MPNLIPVDVDLLTVSGMTNFVNGDALLANRGFEVLNKEFKLSVDFSLVCVVCIDEEMDAFDGFGVAQHRHLSADSELEARHVSQFHFGSELTGLILKKLIGSLFSLDFEVSVELELNAD